MAPTTSPQKEKKVLIDRSELKMYLLWAAVLGIGTALFFWGCGPPQPKHPPRPLPFQVTSVSKSKDVCRIALQSMTENVMVTIRRNCIKRGVTDITFIAINPKDDGRNAADDAAFIMIKYFGAPPTLAPVAITRTPNGNAAFLFVVVDIQPSENIEIKRDIKIHHFRH
jgi:hypothetical protein